ncbi:hypothetical protein [Rhizobium straminoryzae]|uniref:Uncharacterized protein n=1 Tax=Rhizobium straminoryzae TaxID=1387186 RepID=A0A549T0V0_9HYPH|nr:hypothetical protein [Rhizobium straminoryzae]TRL35490.1 hypothetical protein FNA46_20015 [Rhizobium straminoryzae]
MTDEAMKLAAFAQMIKALQRDAAEILEAVNAAATHIDEGHRNSAVGALCVLDFHLERVNALKTAVLTLHRVEPL